MRRILLVVLAVAVTVGLAGAPASAQTKTRKDEVGDAPANIDIRSAKVQNGARRLVVTVRFTTVQRARTTAEVSLVPDGTDGAGAGAGLYRVRSVPVSGGRYATRLHRVAPGELEEVRVRCAGLRSRWKRGARGHARIVVPQSCLGDDAGRIGAGVTSYDKQRVGRRLAPADARRGDESGVLGDAIDSFITTRRG